MDDIMDLGLGDPHPAAAATNAATTAGPRFAPKQKGKPLKLAAPKPEPVDIKPPSAPIPTIDKCEIEPSKDPVSSGKRHRDDDDDDDDLMKSDDDNEEVDDDYDDERGSEDEVVQEIDVYLTASPIADGASVSFTNCISNLIYLSITQYLIENFTIYKSLHYSKCTWNNSGIQHLYTSMYELSNMLNE